MSKFFLAMILAALAFADDSIRFQEPEIRLWPEEARGGETWNPSTDGFHRVTNIHNPSITVFLPPKEKANGAAFIVCPGGGHQYLVMDLEGALVARKLNEMGIAAFVLKSRLARAPGSTYKVEVESLADAQRAIRVVRSRAREWRVDPARVGIMGFSAGGEIAALAETRFQPGDANASDQVERASSRPDFVVLGYPGLRPPYPNVPARDSADIHRGGERRQFVHRVGGVLRKAKGGESPGGVAHLSDGGSWIRDDRADAGVCQAARRALAGGASRVDDGAWFSYVKFTLLGYMRR